MLPFPFTTKHVKSLYYGQCYSLTRQSHKDTEKISITIVVAGVNTSQYNFQVPHQYHLFQQVPHDHQTVSTPTNRRLHFISHTMQHKSHTIIHNKQQKDMKFTDLLTI